MSDSDSDGMESHDEYTLDFPEYLRAIQAEQTSDGKIKGFRPTLEPTKIHAPRTASRPRRTTAENRCLAALVTINGREAFTLFDSGIDEAYYLQLGTKGSLSQISHSCNASYKFGNARASISGDDYYFDIANVDRYDAVLGTVFMRKHGISLDFEYDTIRIQHIPAPTLSEGEETKEMTRRYAKRVSNKVQFNSDEEVEIKPRPSKSKEPVSTNQALKARSDIPEPPWSRYAPTIEDINEDDDGRRPAAPLNRQLPVLLTPDDFVSTEDLSKIVNETLTLDASNPKDRQQILEVNELVQEFTRERFPESQSKETEDSIPKISIEDAIRATSELYKDKTKDITSPSVADTPRLCARWMESCRDIMGGILEELPPLRAVNHEIPLINDKAKYHYYLPRCPDSMKGKLAEKIAQYKRARWWEPCVSTQAAPMLCVPKKDGSDIRTTVDCRKRNENTERDVTPFPDQDTIRLDVARAKLRSKIDLSNAYEQVRIVPSDVWKTAIATIFGTFKSNVMQQGDCNAPSTFQRLMTSIFQDYIGVFMHVYLDDLFIYSDSVEDHERHLKLVFDKLRENKLFMKAEKVQLYAEKMDCLGHLVDDKGLHADSDKLE
ncbi:uncharacterized protein ARMOST_21756 [Armillaria ostoyae]|uniref:Reverse transcriptase domain-containing protein n=1 Tax=Armillaria ostoyae TaxID=47428 RepID=A0A284SB30_ARMOS|nr:uncharacterized protein ARMOST_21756 [Armillaria ostoyae]